MKSLLTGIHPNIISQFIYGHLELFILIRQHIDGILTKDKNYARAVYVKEQVNISILLQESFNKHTLLMEADCNS